MEDLDVIPPHDAEAERVVLCGLLREFAAVGREVRRAGVRGDDFYLDLHRRVWGAVADLAYFGREVGVFTVWEAVGRAGGWGEFPRVGVLDPGRSCAVWLLDLLDDDPTGYWALGAALRVRELAVRRRAIHRARQLIRDAMAGRPVAELVAV